MCGRFYIAPEPEDAALRGLLERLPPGSVKMGEVFPSEAAPVLANNRRLEPGMFVMRWGMERSDGRGLVINARSESAAQRSMFRDSAVRRRCLIPASFYYEWDRRGGGKKRYAIGPAAGGFVWLGGLYVLDSAARTGRFVVLTRAADASVAFVHERMPVLVSDNDISDWLLPEKPLDQLLSAKHPPVVARETRENTNFPEKAEKSG